MSHGYQMSSDLSLSSGASSLFSVTKQTFYIGLHVNVTLMSRRLVTNLRTAKFRQSDNMYLLVIVMQRFC